LSLSILVASAALGMAAQPVHTTELEHRGSTYRVDYRPHVETSFRTIGMAAGTRPSTQRCVVTANVSVERVIGEASGRELKSMLPGQERFVEQLPGNCRGREDSADKLIAGKSSSLAAHLNRAAAEDRPAALAAIDAAHHFASN